MDRAVLAINSSIWDGERWWVLHIYICISLSLFTVKADQGWRDEIARRAPIGRFGEQRRKEGRHRLFVDIINHGSGVETSSLLRGKRTRRRKKEEEVERQGRVRPGRKFVDMQNRFSSAVSSTPPSLFLLLSPLFFPFFFSLFFILLYSFHLRLGKNAK